MSARADGRGVVGRRVRVSGERGAFTVAAVNDDGTLNLCRERAARGGKCYERHGLERSAVKFMRGDFRERGGRS